MWSPCQWLMTTWVIGLSVSDRIFATIDSPMSGDPPASKTTTPWSVITKTEFPSWGSSNGSCRIAAQTPGANSCQVYVKGLAFAAPVHDVCTMARKRRANRSFIVVIAVHHGDGTTTALSCCCDGIFRRLQWRRLLIELSKCVDELFGDVFDGVVRIVDAEAGRLAIAHVGRAENPVEDREVVAEVAFAHGRVLHVMPAVQLRADQDVLERAELPGQVRVAEHAEEDIARRPNQDRFGRRPQDHHRQQEHRAVENLLQRMKAHAGEEIEVHGAVMRLV